eukprot:3171393-Pyramimonas_sp.AAC.1
MPKLYTTHTPSPPLYVPEAIEGWQVGQSASSTTVSQSVVCSCLQGILLRSFIQYLMLAAADADSAEEFVEAYQVVLCAPVKAIKNNRYTRNSILNYMADPAAQ